MKTNVNAHTPGPWTAEGENNCWVDGCNAEGQTALVAKVSFGSPATQEQRANARLIAAAPELLEALKEMLLQHGVRGGNGPSAKARAAIKKATGAA
jgi:hypothetical protein